MAPPPHLGAFCEAMDSRTVNMLAEMCVENSTSAGRDVCDIIAYAIAVLYYLRDKEVAVRTKGEQKYERILL